MRLNRHATARAENAFTLAEVLAALAFLAIVIPVAMQGLFTASLAGEMAVRKPQAARIAQRVLRESIVTGQAQGSAANGVIEEENQVFRYAIRMQPWTESSMNMATVVVDYTVKGRDYQLTLNTLVPK